jgi:hypothetical protein
MKLEHVPVGGETQEGEHPNGGRLESFGLAGEGNVGIFSETWRA